MGQVKGEDKRARKAQETRRRMLEAASELFVQHGYGATTLQEIADQAGVAVQTIYFTFGNKRALLKKLIDVSIAGDHEPIATMDRPWFHEALTAETADAQLRLHVRGTRGILERVAPIIEMLRAAASADPGIAELWDQDADPRFTVHAAAARSLVTKPGIRPGVTAEHAADLLFGLLSPELYLLFVRDRGWSPDQWERWSYETLTPQLCVG
ncbi:TetR/AcrR family transcriptional regulator [Planotetraspora phitsanulokensis]|uniref:TetR family transcriptional regulator n=1 Tax=Planotetraspora phitsanulokensis TaxID=575192 RepID=A0A8J3TZJ3_9ACTN|nr:TetR/AcrR family transcriptional regulator [Planotetraspora phitsanulokensis]GII35605.1 TetR family transcriptional regulator [Planotetraspora phitsanulokensis]